MATTKRVRTTKSTNTEKTNGTPAVATTKNTATGEVARVKTHTVDIQDAIRVRAYEIYVQRGGQHGRDCEDWLNAEAEVLSRFGARTA